MILSQTAVNTKKTTITTIPKFKTEVVTEMKKDSMSCLIFNVFIMGCVSSPLACLGHVVTMLQMRGFGIYVTLSSFGLIRVYGCVSAL